MLNKPELRQMLGKRIQSIVTVTNAQHPPSSIFFVFDDDTHFEFFGNNIEVSNLYPGGVDVVLHYVGSAGGVITQFNT